MIHQFPEELVGDVGDDDSKGLCQACPQAPGQFIGCVVQFLGNLDDPVAQGFADALVLGLAAEDK